MRSTHPDVSPEHGIYYISGQNRRLRQQRKPANDAHKIYYGKSQPQSSTPSTPQMLHSNNAHPVQSASANEAAAQQNFYASRLLHIRPSVPNVTTTATSTTTTLSSSSPTTQSPATLSIGSVARSFNSAPLYPLSALSRTPPVDKNVHSTRTFTSFATEQAVSTIQGAFIPSLSRLSTHDACMHCWMNLDRF